MTKYFRRKVLKFFVYALIVFAAYIIQTTPGLIDFLGVKPILVLPACISIAVFEGEFAGGLFGFCFGLFCDSTSETVFGFNALLFLVFCVLAGLLTIYVFRRSTMNVMLLCLGALFFRSGLEFFFKFILYGYENLDAYFYTQIAPQIVFSAIFSFPFCVLFRWLNKKFEPEDTKE
ncbi:MAG: rod shape-determining protein MreD [Oscillospiraceae bacterium]|nr:rod shape-determining protein MreD [Oscillospiraceae bacterium]